MQPDVKFAIVTSWTASAPGPTLPIWKHLCCITALPDHLRSLTLAQMFQSGLRHDSEGKRSQQILSQMQI